MTKVGDIAIEVMREEESSHIGYNEYGMLDEVFSRAHERGILKESGSRGGMLRPHPINRQTTILNCLENDKRFEKYYIHCCSRSREAEMIVREFKLKGEGVV